MKTKLLTLFGVHLGLAAVVAQPVITNQPQNQTAIAGSNATFTVGATGAPPLSYQWRSHLNNPSFTNIPFGTEATLVLTNAQPTSRRFAVVVTDASSLSVTSNPLVTLTVLMPPGIVTQPSSPSAVAGESAILSAVAEGTAPLAYQWRLNGQTVSGATQTTLAFAAIQFSNAGPYTVIVTNLVGSITSEVAMVTVVPATLYTHVTNGPVATDRASSTGAVWADFNNDGWLDLYVVQYEGTNHFYRNNGNGDFTRITQGDVLTTDVGSLGVSAVDYDNDGHLDLAVGAGGAETLPKSNSLFHNNGDGTFTRVTAGGMGNTVGHLFATDWADYDNDGFLDALISDPGGRDNNNNQFSGTNQLWHNNGDGTFTRVTSSPVSTDRGFAWGGLWFDYDSDGRPDLLTLNIQYNGGWTNYLYHNEGNGGFTRNLTSPIGAERLSGGCEGADWGDYDNDGLLDLFVADSGGVRSHLYHNNGGGSFSNVTTGPMLTPPAGSQPHGASWGDYDNDGYLDLVVVHAYQNVLYRNNHDGTFSEVRHAGFAADVVADPFFFNNMSWVDYDNDGFLDLHFCLASDSVRPNYLYHNSGNSNRWLEVKCVGTVANRSAIGARIRVKATIDGRTLWQVRELKSSAGWDVAAPLVAHFGLGNATNVETLRIEWPSGTVQELHNVAPKQILTIIEPPRLTATKVSGEPQFTLKGGRNMAYDIEVSTNLTAWSPVTTVPITNLNGTASISDPSLPAARQKFYRAVAR